MTFVVPYDGSDLAETALVRAGEFGDVLDERVVAVTVVPRGNADYARERDWLGPDEAFDMHEVASRLHDRVHELVPSADFRTVDVDRYAPSGTISNEITRVAREEDASMLFIGSENAGRIVTSVSSVGGSVSGRVTFDVVIVRNREPSKVPRLERAGDPEGKSDFFLT